MIRAKLPDPVFRKLSTLKRNQGYGDKDWNDWLTFLCRSTPADDTHHTMISKATGKALGKMWMENFADNMSDILWARVRCNKCEVEYEANTWMERDQCYLCGSNNVELIRTRNVSEFSKYNGTAGIVIGAGPSVRPELGSPHLDMIAEDWKGITIVTDRMTVPCLEKGIIPTVIGAIDGSRTHILNWFKHPIVKEYADQLHVFCGATIANNVVKHLLDIGAHVYFYNPLMDRFSEGNSLSRRMAMMTGLVSLSSGGNVGTASLVMAYYLQANPIGLVGIDFGYREGDPIESTPYYSSMIKGTNGNVAAARAMFKTVHHPFFGTTALSDHIFWHYREAFLDLMLTFKSFRVINATEGGCLYGDKVECMWLKDFINEFTNEGIIVPKSDRYFAPPPEVYEMMKKEEEDD